MGLLAKEVLYQLLNAGHARLSANQHDLIDLAGLDTRVLHRLLARTYRALDDVFHQLFQLCTGQLLHQVLRTGRISGDERQIDLAFHRRRELDLGLLRRITETLQGHFIALGAQVESFFLLELFHQPIDDALIEVVATQVRVTIRGLHLDDALAHFQYRNVESTAAKVVDRNGLVLLLVQTVCERRSRGLVHDALHIQTGDLARAL